MSREDVFRVRHSSLPPIAEGVAEQGIINRLGMQVVVDFYTQLGLSGLVYLLAMGNEDAGAAFTAAVDDELAALLVDNNAGYALLPLRVEACPGVVAGATLAMGSIVLDTGGKRWASGGTLTVPANLNSQSAAGSFAGQAYIAGASDVVPGAKTSSVKELSHIDWLEDALANTIGYPGAWQRDVYNVRSAPQAVGHGACSFIAHIGSATADMTGYARAEFAQLTIAQVAI